MPSSESGWRNSRLWAVLPWAATQAATLNFAIYRSVSPQYEARSVLEIHTRRPILFPDANETSADRATMAQRTIETEINAIEVDSILDEAVADPSVVNLPSIKGSAWPVALVRDRLEVHQIPRTELISVSYKSHEPVEAANIVNAVVRTYVDTARNRSSDGDEQYMRSKK